MLSVMKYIIASFSIFEGKIFDKPFSLIFEMLLNILILKTIKHIAPNHQSYMFLGKMKVR